jgi:hypothetical protein
MISSAQALERLVTTSLEADRIAKDVGPTPQRAHWADHPEVVQRRKRVEEAKEWLSDMRWRFGYPYHVTFTLDEKVAVASVSIGLDSSYKGFPFNATLACPATAEQIVLAVNTSIQASIDRGKSEYDAAEATTRSYMLPTPGVKEAASEALLKEVVHVPHVRQHRDPEEDSLVITISAHAVARIKYLSDFYSAPLCAIDVELLEEGFVEAKDGYASLTPGGKAVFTIWNSVKP